LQPHERGQRYPETSIHQIGFLGISVSIFILHLQTACVSHSWDSPARPWKADKRHR